MKKVIVQIPAYNEADQISKVIKAIPRSLGSDATVEVLVIDDGSTDQTISVAIASGADHVFIHKHNRGLARAFESGIDACLELGADIIVNIDADMQYEPSQIPAVAAPIIEGAADITIGDRQIWKTKLFSPVKRLTQLLGSKIVSSISGQAIPDAVSGFRAYSRDAALDLNILSDFSYTTESIIQAGSARRKIVSVPVSSNQDLRPSRLARSAFQFVMRQALTIIRARIMYRPLRTFFSIGALFFLVGLVPIARFAYFYMTNGGDGHVQSLILGAALLIFAFLAIVLGIIADLVGFNRKLLERNLRISKKILFDSGD